MKYLVFALLLVGAFYGQLLSAAVSPAAIAAGAYLLVLGVILSNKVLRPKLSPIALMWSTFALFALLSQLTSIGYDGWSTYAFACGACLLLIANTTTSWMRPAIIVSAVLSLGHVLATLFFYVAPSAYSILIKARFFATNPNATDYKSALTSHYSYNALYCTIAFAIGCALALGTTRRSVRWAGAIMAIVSLSAVLLTGKRAHILLSIITFLVAISMSHLRGRGLWIAGFGMVGTFGVYLASLFSPGIAASLERLSSTFNTTDLAELTSGRTLLWEAAIAGWREKPIVGHGWGSYEYLWPGGTQSSFHAHNAVLNTLYEAGTIGTVWFVIAVAVTLVQSFRVVRRAKDLGGSERQVSAYFALMVQVFLVLYSFTSGELLTSAYTIAPYIVSVAIVVALSRALTAHCAGGTRPADRADQDEPGRSSIRELQRGGRF